MNFHKTMAAAGVAFALLATPVLAGDATMSRSDGYSIKIKCRNSGCTVKGKPAGGSWGTVEKTQGGSSNFNKLVSKYEGMGFSS